MTGPNCPVRGFKRIAVLMGGRSGERQVSLKTGTAVLQALQRSGYTAAAVDAGGDLCTQLRENPVDAAFIALHGPFGEDGTVQGLLELLGIPYTGSGVLASALAMNKVAAKKLFCYHGIPTPAFQSFAVTAADADACAAAVELPLPVVVKPAEEGSTIAVSITHCHDDLAAAIAAAFRHCPEVLVEEYVPGRELTVGLLDREALPVIEIVAPGGFYDYAAKYAPGATTYSVAPHLPPGLGEYLQRTAVAAAEALGCCGAVRVDFRGTDTGDTRVLEINTIPGMTETSLLPMAARQAGIGFDALVERILAGASLHKRCPAVTEAP